MILTHPHEDHVAGFAEVLEHVQPERIGLAGPPPPGRGLYAQLQAMSVLAASTPEVLKRDQLLAAAEALKRWEDERGRAIDPLHDGCALGLGSVDAMVRAPDLAGMEALLERPWRAVRHRANDLSLVLELRYGDTRIVLGGDLPVRRGNHKVRTGWSGVMDRHAHLVAHQGLKVSHHGSRDALEARLLGSRLGGEDACRPCWWVTPFSSQSLPRTADGEGMAALLAACPLVRLTALPAGRNLQPQQSPPARLTRAELHGQIAAIRGTTSGFLGDAVPLRPVGGLHPLDPIWCSAFDRTGRMAGSWRGRVALEVEP